MRTRGFSEASASGELLLNAKPAKSYGGATAGAAWPERGKGQAGSRIKPGAEP